MGERERIWRRENRKIVINRKRSEERRENAGGKNT